MSWPFSWDWTDLHIVIVIVENKLRGLCICRGKELPSLNFLAKGNIRISPGSSTGIHMIIVGSQIIREVHGVLLTSEDSEASTGICEH